MDNDQMWKAIQESLDSLEGKIDNIDTILRGNGNRDGVVPELKAIKRRLDEYEKGREEDKEKITKIDNIIRGEGKDPGILARQDTIEKWVAARVWIERIFIALVITELFGLGVLIAQHILTSS